MTTFPDSHHDLLEGDWASLATIRADGFPQVTEVWFLHEDGHLKLSLNRARLKTRNLEARPQCSLFLLDNPNPLRYLEVRGLAQIAADHDYAFADRLGAKYGVDLRINDKPGEQRVCITVEPVNIYAVDLRR